MLLLVINPFSSQGKAQGNFVNSYLNELKNLGVESKEINSIVYLFLLSLKYFIKYGFNRSRYPRLIVNYGSLHSLKALCYFGKKIVIIRGSDWYHTPTKNRSKNIHSFLQTSFTKFSVRYFDLIITVSRRLKEELSDYFNQNDLRIEVLSTPIDYKRFPFISKEEARKVLGYSNSDFIVSFAAVSLSKENKGYSLFLNAINICLSKNIIIKPLILSNIDHDKLYLYYAATDYHVLNSRYEGFPNVIKEAIVCGRPFIATDVSDLKGIAEALPQGCGNIFNGTQGALVSEFENLHNKSKPEIDRNNAISTLEMFEVFSIDVYANKLFKFLGEV